MDASSTKQRRSDDGRRTPIAGVTVHAALIALMLQGCAALPLAALGTGALEAGGGALVKTGTEYTASGTARRTFAIPLERVHGAVLEAFRRTEIGVKEDEASAKGQYLVGAAQHRTVRIRLVPLTPVLTSMELVVKRNFLASDKATASELLAATEQVLAEDPMFAPRIAEVPDGSTVSDTGDGPRPARMVKRRHHSKTRVSSPDDDRSDGR